MAADPLLHVVVKLQGTEDLLFFMSFQLWQLMF